ncbi:hypothetical protein D3C81_1488030 [compost metagenome]
MVDEIYEAFQNMTFGEVDLAHSHLLHSRSYRFKEVFYDLQKVFEYLNNSSYPLSMVDYHLKRLVNVGVLPSFVSLETDRLDLQLLLLVRLVDTNNLDSTGG